MGIVRQLLGFRPGRNKNASGATFQISPLVQVSEHDAGLALLNIRSGQVFVCNRTGSRIWKALNEGRRPEEITVEISQAYGVGIESAEQDTVSFVGELERRGLIIRS